MEVCVPLPWAGLRTSVLLMDTLSLDPVGSLAGRSLNMVIHNSYMSCVRNESKVSKSRKYCNRYKNKYSWLVNNAKLFSRSNFVDWILNKGSLRGSYQSISKKMQNLKRFTFTKTINHYSDVYCILVISFHN